MKKLVITILSTILLIPIYAQTDTIPVPDTPIKVEAPAVPETEEIPEVEAVPEVMETPVTPENPDMVLETPDKTQIKVGENDLIIVEENGDTTRIKLGNKGISVVEGKNGYTINVMDMAKNEELKAEKDEANGDEESDEGDEDNGKKKKKFKAHYAGFDLGLNNFLTVDHTMLNQGFMNLNTAKSWNYNINFLDYGFGLGTSYAGIVTGMGFEFSNYIFDGQTSIVEDGSGNIIERVDLPANITKSKLSMTYLTAPLLLEFQIPAGKKRIHISGGVIGGVKLGSKTKIVYQEDGKQKDVRKDDFSLSPLRYGLMVRAGYRSLNLYATYYITPLFGETNTPELNPFSVGLTLVPF